MICIPIENCQECPFCEIHKGESTCSKLHHDVSEFKKEVFTFCPFPVYSYPKNEEKLKQIKAKKTKKPKTDKNIQNTAMWKEVCEVYEAYLHYCPNMREFDLSIQKNNFFKQCIIGINHCGKDNIKKLLQMAGESDFLNGRIQGCSWTADFKWIFRPALQGDVWNCDKILNGNYNNKSFKKESFFKDKERTYGENWKK